MDAAYGLNWAPALRTPDDGLVVAAGRSHLRRQCRPSSLPGGGPPLPFGVSHRARLRVVRELLKFHCPRLLLLGRKDLVALALLFDAAEVVADFFDPLSEVVKDFVRIVVERVAAQTCGR